MRFQGGDMMTTTMIDCGLILIGAVLMLFSIVRSRRILEAMPLIPTRLRGRITGLCNMHRLLMSFFLVGYVVVLVGFGFQLIVLVNFLVAVIFLFGAVFVFMGVTIETRLLSEIQNTISGLLPICAKCKKIRESGSDHTDPESWKPIEVYITARADVNFTHGYCPECYEKLVRDSQLNQ